MQKSNLLHTALFCKGWYKIIHTTNNMSFKDFTDLLWKNMAIYLEEDCMYKFNTQGQVLNKLLTHIDNCLEAFKIDNCQVGKLQWLYNESKRVQSYEDNIDFEAAMLYVCYVVLQCAHKDTFSEQLIPDFTKFEMSDTIVERIKDEPDFLLTHQCILPENK